MLITPEDSRCRALQEPHPRRRRSNGLPPVGFPRWMMACAGLCLLVPLLGGGIPEPDLIWYGTVQARASGQTVRMTSGTLAWRIEPLGGGEAWTVSTTLTNIHDQFSFILRVPCESPEPGQPATSSPGVASLRPAPNGYRRATVTLDGKPLVLATATAEFNATPADRGRIERVDLVLVTELDDTDLDGMSDAWERQFLGGTAANPEDDPDGDGVNNLREFRAGTHPKDARSLFEIVEVEAATGGIRIRWSSQPNHSYRIRRAPSLLSSISEFTVLRGGIPATAPLNEFLDQGAGGPRSAFYLIEIEEQP